jgi:hypothetical protein
MKRLYALVVTKKFIFDGHQFKECRRCRICIGDGAMLALQVHLADDHHLGVDAAITEANRISEQWKRRHQ